MKVWIVCNIQQIMLFEHGMSRALSFVKCVVAMGGDICLGYLPTGFEEILSLGDNKCVYPPY